MFTSDAGRSKINATCYISICYGKYYQASEFRTKDHKFSANSNSGLQNLEDQRVITNLAEGATSITLPHPWQRIT